MGAQSPLDFVDTTVRVRYAETDGMGVVYYANYLVWFEVGRVAWCHARGFRYRDMEREGHYLMVASAECRYKAPALFEDEIQIRTAIASANERVLRFAYQLRKRESGHLLATGATTHVITDLELRPARLPERYRPYFGLAIRD